MYSLSPLGDPELLIALLLCSQLRRWGEEHFFLLGFREMLIVIPSVIWTLSFVKYGVLAPVKVCSFVLRWCRGWSEVNSACCWCLFTIHLTFSRLGLYLLNASDGLHLQWFRAASVEKINPNLFYSDTVKLLPESNLKSLQFGTPRAYACFHSSYYCW